MITNVITKLWSQSIINRVTMENVNIHFLIHICYAKMFNESSGMFNYFTTLYILLKYNKLLYPQQMLLSAEKFSLSI